MSSPAAPGVIACVPIAGIASRRVANPSRVAKFPRSEGVRESGRPTMPAAFSFLSSADLVHEVVDVVRDLAGQTWHREQFLFRRREEAIGTAEVVQQQPLTCRTDPR